MKQIIIATLLIVGISVAYAGGLSMLHVGSADGNGGVVSSCDGSIDLSTGCVQPMLR